MRLVGPVKFCHRDQAAGQLPSLGTSFEIKRLR
jgi:hypothetical protein